MKRFEDISVLARALAQVRTWRELIQDKDLTEAATILWSIDHEDEEFGENIGLDNIRAEANRLAGNQDANDKFAQQLSEIKNGETKSEAMDPVLREKLLEDLEKHEQLRAEEWAEKMKSQRSGGKNPSKEEVARVIKRKQELQKEIKARIQEQKPGIDQRTKERVADSISDRLVVEEGIWEQKLGVEKSQKITETVAQKTIEGWGENRDIGKIETAIVATLTEAKLSEVKDRSVREEISDLTQEVVAERTVSLKIQEEAGKLSDKIEKELGVNLGIKAKEDLTSLCEEKIERSVKETGATVADSRVVKAGPAHYIGEDIVSDIKEITKAENVGTSVEIAVVEASRQMTQWLGEEKAEVIEGYRGAELKKEIEITLLADKNNRVEDIREYAKVVTEIRHKGGSSSPAGAEARTIANLENIRGKNGERFTPDAIRRGVEDAEVLTNMLRDKDSIAVQVDRYFQIRDRLGQMPKQPVGVEAVDRMMATLQKNEDHIIQSLDFVKKAVNFKDFLVNRLTGATATKVTGPMFMSQSMDVFLTNSASQFAAFGLKQGLKNIIGGIFSGGVKAAAAGATQAGVSAAAGSAAAGGAAVLGASGPPGWVIAAIIFGVKLLSELGKKLSAFGKELMEKFLGKEMAGAIANLNPFGKLKRAIQEVLPGPLGVIAGAALSIVGVFLGLPALMMSISIAGLIAWVIPGLIIGLVVYELFVVGPVLMTITPPPIGQQVCQWVKAGSDQNPSGDINCNQGIADQSVAGIVSKEVYADLANRWQGGKNYALECFNDVVSRSRCMGVNPAFALWIWLHESGASNYDIRPDIEDFGIHGQASAPPRDFNAQINYFLKLTHGNACANLPFWLGWATNYLTGGCDPDKEMKPGDPTTTGKAFLNQLQTQIGLISTTGMINAIRTGGGGENCDFGEQTWSNTVNDVGETKPGYVWVCEDNPNNPTDYGEQSPFTPVDPIFQEDCSNSPGCAVVQRLQSCGITSVNRSNVGQAVACVNSWTDPPAGFNKNGFNSMMSANVSNYNFFQCVAFNVGVDSRMRFGGADRASWENTIRNGNGNCVPIDPANAGAGDHILYKVGGWYHIQMITVLRPDGSYIISDANNNAVYNGDTQVQGGAVRNMPGTGGIAAYMSTKNPLRVVLRCGGQNL